MPTKRQAEQMLNQSYQVLQDLRDPSSRIALNDPHESFDVPEGHSSRLSLRIEDGALLQNIEPIVKTLNLLMEKDLERQGRFVFEKKDSTLRFFASVDLKGLIAKVELEVERFAQEADIKLGTSFFQR